MIETQATETLEERVAGAVELELNGSELEPALQHPTPLLTLTDVAVAYEANDPVVQDVSLSIFAGETVLFLGPSGCGKSTLAMLCGGLLPNAVEGIVQGQVWRHARLNESGRIGYVFQDAEAQFCMLTVADEVAFGLENLSLPRAEMPARITKALRTSGLSVTLNAMHAEFSGGMKQKLAIACAMAMDADLLVFDEPTANLDPLSTGQVFDQIGSLREQKKTMIVIEHKFDRLLPYMDRVVLFGPDGRIHRIGPTLEVLREEWSWLVSVGVVPPWKAFPNWLESEGQVSLKPRMSFASAMPTPDSAQGSRPSMLWGDAQSNGQNNVASASHDDVPTTASSTEHGTMALEIEHGGFQYGKRVAIWTDLSIAVPRGSFTAIVGPNGAGKSTLLQVFAGLQRLSAGEVRLLGKSTQAWKQADLSKMVSFCFQNPEFQFIYQRVADELANRVVADDVPPEVTELLGAFGLAGLDQHSPFGLSQGQKRRLSVAAMVREEHELYLLDEPTFGQDAGTQAAILERLAHLHRQGKTVVMTTHDMDLVRNYAQQVIVISAGGLLYMGAPQQLFERSDILAKAHLLDDVTAQRNELESEPEPDTAMDMEVEVDSEMKSALGAVSGTESGLPVTRGTRNIQASDGGMKADRVDWTNETQRKTLAERLNPSWLLVTTLLTMTIAVAAHNLSQGLAMLALPITVLVLLRGLTPWQVLKRLSPFLMFYVLYVWSLTAFAVVPPGTHTFDFLWMHLSWPGFMTGLILAFRMLGAVAFGVLFVSSMDITELIVGLSQNFRVPPKFSYGILAGLRFVPLFQTEWMKLKQARQLRGKETRYKLFRPVTYALPLLSQAIRMSERVATAMEARGFHGPVATRSSARTYYRSVPVHMYDFLYMALVVGATIGLLALLQ